MAGGSGSWHKETDEKINYTKLCRLLVDGGTQAIRSVFDGIIRGIHVGPPSSLKAILNANKTALENLKKPPKKVLNNEQWDKLYPPSGSNPKSEDFDITLLFVLLRNICGLAPPSTGWDALPPITDNSLEGNLARIKYYRNNTIAHKPNTDINDADFEQCWQDISSALLSLRLSQEDIDDLKSAPLGVKNYNQLLYDWYISDKDIKTQLDGIKSNTDLLPGIQEGINQLKRVHTNLHIDLLAKPDFSSLIEMLCKTKYHPNTRQWILSQVTSHVDSDQPESCVMLITAGPGMGKSTIAAKICQMYKDLGGLAACHFFQFSNSTRNNPRLMLQSIARQMCDTVPGYGEALNRRLQSDLGKEIAEMNCEELLTVLLEEPLCNLEQTNSKFVVVIDALDECPYSPKYELMRALRNKLLCLPSWLRFIITSRPSTNTSVPYKTVAVKIEPEDQSNLQDLESYFCLQLTSLYPQHDKDGMENLAQTLVRMTKGLFLVAFFAIDYLKKENISDPEKVVEELFPNGISSVYENYFSRLKEVLLPYISEKERFYKMLDAVVATKNPLPKNMFYNILGLKSERDVPRTEIQARKNAVNSLHWLFPVESDHVAVFHKSVFDWLTQDDGHDFSVHVEYSEMHELQKQRRNTVEESSSDTELQKREEEAYCPPVDAVEDKDEARQLLTDIQKEKRTAEKPSSNLTVNEKCSKQKGNEFSVDLEFGDEVIENECYDVLSDLLNGEKDLDKPLDLTDSEKYALRLGWGGFNNELVTKEGIEEYGKLRNYFTLAGYLCYICSIVLDELCCEPYVDLRHDLRMIILHGERYFRKQYHFKCCHIFTLNFGCYFEFVLNAAYYKKVSEKEMSPNPGKFLETHNLSYFKRENISIDLQGGLKVLQTVACENGCFLLVQSKQNTELHKYDKDGTCVANKSFLGDRAIIISPDHRFIVVRKRMDKDDIEKIDTTTVEKGDIEIIDTTTLNVVTSYQSPNVIRSCHVFGDHPWYIVARCFNNKIYVMEGEAGTIVSMVAGIGQYLEVEAVGYLGHILLGTSNRYNDTLFTDEDGNFLEEMTNLQGKHRILNFYQRKLFLCHFNNPEEMIPIYPTKVFGGCISPYNCPNRPGDGESVCFSQDGRFLAFHYNNYVFIKNTSDCSLYKRVHLGTSFTLHNDEGISFLNKDYLIVHNEGQIDNDIIMIINVHTNEIVHRFPTPTIQFQVLPSITASAEPFTLFTVRKTEQKYELLLYVLQKLDL